MPLLHQEHAVLAVVLLALVVVRTQDWSFDEVNLCSPGFVNGGRDDIAMAYARLFHFQIVRSSCLVERRAGARATQLSLGSMRALILPFSTGEGLLRRNARDRAQALPTLEFPRKLPPSCVWRSGAARCGPPRWCSMDVYG